MSNSIKNSVWGIILIISSIYVYFNMKPVMGLLPVPPHKSYEFMLQKVQSEYPNQTVRLINTKDHNITYYASYEANRDENLAILNANGAKDLYSWEAVINSKDNLTKTIHDYTLDGQLKSFDRGILEKTMLPPVSQVEARAMAVRAAKKMGIPIDEWTEESYRKAEASSGRIDHIYQFKSKKPIFSRAYQAVEIKITGNEVGAVSRFNKLPTDYAKKIQDFTAIKILLAGLSQFGMLLMFAFGIFSANKIRKVGFVWRTSTRYLVLLGVCMVGVMFNSYAISLVGKPPYLSDVLLLVSYIKQTIETGWSTMLAYALIVICSLSINQQVYPHRPSMSGWFKWQAYGCADNRRIVYVAYLATLIFVIYQVLFYDICNNNFNFFMPSHINQDLNHDMYFIPFLSPMLQAVQPGLTEELLFRVIPLGGALLLLRSPGRVKMGGLVLLQAVIFAAAHVTYPGEPFFARLLELIIPAIGFAWLFLRVDLMAAVLTHILFDCMWMGITNFRITDLSVDQILYFVVFFAPLILCFIGSRVRQSALLTNATEKQDMVDYSLRSDQKFQPQNVRFIAVVAFISVLALGKWFEQKDIPRSNLGYDESIAGAKAHWQTTSPFDLEQWLHISVPMILDENVAYLMESSYSDSYLSLIPRFMQVGCSMVTSVPADRLDQKGFVLKTLVCKEGVVAAGAVWPFDAKAQGKFDNAQNVFERYLKGVITPADYSLSVKRLATKSFPHRVYTNASFKMSEYQGVRMKGSDMLVAKVGANGLNITDFSTHLEPDEQWQIQRKIDKSWLGMINFYVVWMTIIVGAATVLFARFSLRLTRRELLMFMGVCGGFVAVNAFVNAPIGQVNNMEFGRSQSMALWLSIIASFYSVSQGALFYLVRFSRMTIAEQLQPPGTSAAMGVLLGSLISLLVAVGIYFIPYNVISHAHSVFALTHTKYPMITLAVMMLSFLMYALMKLHFMFAVRKYTNTLGYFCIITLLLFLASSFLSEIHTVSALGITLSFALIAALASSAIFYSYGFVASLWSWLVQIIIWCMVATDYSAVALPGLVILVILVAYMTRPELFVRSRLRA